MLGKVIADSLELLLAMLRKANGVQHNREVPLKLGNKRKYVGAFRATEFMASA